MVIAESFLSSDAPEAVGDILIQNGKFAFRHYGHNYFIPDRSVRVPVGEFMPAVFEPRVGIEIDRQFELLISDLRLSWGCINFGGIISDGTFYIVDIALRNGGNYLADLIKLSTGFDLTKALIYAALGLQYPCHQRYFEKANPVLSYMPNTRKVGQLARISVSSEIEEFIEDRVLFVKPGDPIIASESYQALGVFLLRLPDTATTLQIANQIADQILIELT